PGAQVGGSRSSALRPRARCMRPGPHLRRHCRRGHLNYEILKQAPTSGEIEIGPREVTALAEQRALGDRSHRVRATVAEVEPGRVPPFAKANEGFLRRSPVLLTESDLDR